MSFSKLEEICCPCGEKFEAELWNSINSTEDPDLKEALLCGEINIVCCPACAQIFYADHFILYHDSSNELLAFVYPQSFSEQEFHWTKRMEEDFDKAMSELLPEQRVNYEPILLFGLDTLVNLIRTEEEISDESAVLEYIAKDLGLSVIYLKPSLARAAQLPFVLPYKKLQKNSTLREEILTGLNSIIKYNEHLLHYKKFLAIIEKNKNWALDEKIIKSR